ncbi:MAG: hypothetical protein P8Y42_10610 [Exilibacterium sp.]
MSVNEINHPLINHKIGLMRKQGHLNENGYIVPVLGGVGDKIFATK